MTSITENPAVIDPRKALNPTQRAALGALAFFRYQHRDANGWRVGNRKFKHPTIVALESMDLVRRRGNRIELTQAGTIASDRLKGGAQ